jgi:hypothetical protein
VSQVHFAVLIEALFMLLSVMILDRAKSRSWLQWTGMVLLCLTFCWSVILGCVIALNNTTLTL